MKTNIKTVTFDLWETLLFEKDGWSQKRTNARLQNLTQTFNKLGISVSPEQTATTFKQLTTWLTDIWKTDKDATHIDQIQFLIQTITKNQTTPKQEWTNQLSTAHVSALFEVSPYLNPDAAKVLKQLKENNKKIGIICNTGMTPGFGLRQLLAQQGVAEYFDFMLFSDETGIRKPNKQIFQTAAEKSKTNPCNIAHVGDNLKCDVWGAKNAGFKAIHFSTDAGKDRKAESDPTSLVSISRRLDNLKQEQITPDKTINSLTQTLNAIKQLEK